MTCFHVLLFLKASLSSDSFIECHLLFQRFSQKSKPLAFRHWRAPNLVLEAFSPPPSEGDSCLGNWRGAWWWWWWWLLTNHYYYHYHHHYYYHYHYHCDYFLVVKLWWRWQPKSTPFNARISPKGPSAFQRRSPSFGAGNKRKQKPQSAQWRTIYGIFTYKLPTCTYVGKNLNPSLDTKIGLLV